MPLFKPRNQDDYLKQIYGGTPPSMDYYAQLGAQKRANEEAARAAREAQKEAERAAKQAEKEAKKEAKEKKKKEEEAELQALMNKLDPKKASETAVPLTTAQKEQERNRKDTSLLGDLLNIGKNIFKSGSALNPSMSNMADAAKRTAVEYVKDGKKMDSKTKELARGVARTADSSTLGIPSNIAKRRENKELEDLFFGKRDGGGGVADLGYDMLGYLAPGTAIAKGLRGTRFGARTTPEMTRLGRAGQYAKEGAVAGGIFGAAESGVSEAINPDERDWKDHLGSIALESAFGAAADPAIMGVLGGLRRLRPGLDLPTSQRRTDVPSVQKESTPTILDEMPPAEPTNVRVYDGGTSQSKRKDSLMSAYDDTVTKWTDDLNPIRAVFQKQLNRSSKAYEDARVARGASSAMQEYASRTLEPAIASFKGNRQRLQEAFDYITEKHLLDIARKNEQYKLPRNANVAQLEQTVKRFENDPEIQKLSKEVQKYQRGILDMLEREGIISSKTKQGLIKEYPNYIPLYRQKGNETNVDEVFNMYDRLNKGNVRKVIQDLSEYGSSDPVKDPISNLVQYGINAYQAAFNNRALKHVASLNGEKIGNTVIAQKVTSSNRHKFGKENIVKFFDNGKQVEYYVNNDLKRAYDNLKGIMQFDEISNVAAKIAKVQRQSITANPLFSIKQIVRDIPQAWVVGDFSLIKDMPVAFIDSLTKGKLLGNKSAYRKFMEHGGGMNSVVSFDRNSFLALQRASDKLENAGTTKIAGKEIKHAFSKVIDMVRIFNEGLENAPKLAQFRSTARKTGDLRKAAFEGRDIMDFARSGERTRTFNRYAAFINANLQGKSKQFRSLSDPKKAFSTGVKTMMVGAIPSILAKMAVDTYATDEQRAIINEAPEWQRQTYWLIPSPDSNKVWRIPKPYEVALLSSTPLEFIMNNEDKVGTDITDGLKEWLTQAVIVDPTLNPLTPIYETMADKDLFTGMPIVPQREQGLPANEQKDVYTASTASGIANILNNIPGVDISPRKIEHLTEGYFPVSGENINDLIDRLGEIAGIRENHKPKGVTGLENLNPFSMDISQRTSPLISNAYESTGELQDMKRSMQQEGLEFPYHNAYGANRIISDRDRDIAESIRMIDNDPTLTREQKQELRQRYIDERNANVRNAERRGLFNIDDESNLARLEQEFAGLGREQNKDDIRTQLQARLVQAGVPEYAVKEIMAHAKENELSDAELARALEKLLQRYQ